MAKTLTLKLATFVASTDAAKHGPVRAAVKKTSVLNRKSLALGGHIDRRG